MANALQLRRGTTTQHNSFTGLAGEVTVDTDKETVVVHDGSTAGGFPLARASDLTNFDADTLDGKQLATIESEYQAFANTAAANVVDSAPGTLDTLNELAAALGDDPNFATTVTNSIATKMPLAGGTFTGDITRGGTVISDGAISDTGTFTLDVVGNIILDADNSGSIQLKDNNVQYCDLYKSADNFMLYNPISNGDIRFQGNDGGAVITALTLDMSNAGRANFNAGASFQDHVNFGDNDKAVFGASDDLQIYHDGLNSWIKDAGTGNLVLAATNFYLNNAADSQNMITSIDGGEVLLRYAGGTKLQTTSTGIDVTGTAVTDGVTVDGPLDIEEVLEHVETSASTTSTITIEATDGAVWYFTANQTANRTINFRGNSGLSLNSLMNNNQSMTFAISMTQGSTAYYLNAYQIDGSAVTPKWSGGSAPTGGNPSGIDVYTFTIIKTANATFTVLASQTQFA